MSQLIRISHLVNEDIYPLTYKKPKSSDTIYEKKVTFSDGAGRLHSKKLVPWTAGQGKNLESFCEMWNEFKFLQAEWGFENGPGSGPAKFQVFRQCIDKRARNQWDSISRNVTVQNNLNFQNAVHQLIETCGTTNPRDKVTEYLENPQCVRKRRDIDVHVHGARLELLLFYHDMLPRNTPELCGDNEARKLKRKMILFRSFPEEWQENFVRNNDEPHNPNITWQFILQKMELEKTAWDRRSQARTNALRRGGAGRGRPARGHGGPSRNERGGRGQSRPSQYRPYPNPQQQHFRGNYGQYGRYQGQRQGYSSNFPSRNFGNTTANQGRVTNPSNHRFQGTFQRRSTSGRGRGFTPRQQHFQENYHFNPAPETNYYYQGEEPVDHYYQERQDEQTEIQASAEEHGADMHSDGMSGAEALNAEEHYSYDEYLNEHYGYEEEDINHDNLYGQQGDY